MHGAHAVRLAAVDHGDTGADAASAGAAHGYPGGVIQLEAVKLAGARCGHVVLPRRWVVERWFAWTGRVRRVARDDEHVPTTLDGAHDVAVARFALNAASPILAVL